MKAVIAIIFLSVVFLIYFITKDTDTDIVDSNPVYSTSWIETTIKVTYQDNETDTFNIDVYKTLDNIRIEDGNLSYQKSTKRVGGVVAKRIKLASYVKSFRVLRTKHRTKTE